MIRTLKWGVGVALLVLVTSAGKAQTGVEYNWQPADGSGITGTVYYDGSTLSSFVWNGVSYSSFANLNVQVLTEADGIPDLSLSGSTVGSDGKTVYWTAGSSGTTAEVTAQIGLNGPSYSGDWVDTVRVVPEPTTVIAGALLLLPFGASTLQILRRKSVA